MSTNVILRSTKDRLRYVVSFEILLLAILIPAGSLFFEKSVYEVGILGVMLAMKAMLLNLAYNRVFDQFDAKAGRISSQRSHLGRILHAIGFEVFLMVTSLPLYVWWLQVTVMEAILADGVVTTFIVGYTYAFTLAYDKSFPLHSPSN
ncbi:MAG: PACE efflux transporter [Litoreibacter sp.]